jgi:hypothetical protein
VKGTRLLVNLSDGGRRWLWSPIDELRFAHDCHQA